MSDDLTKIVSGDWVLQIKDTATGKRGDVRQVMGLDGRLAHFGHYRDTGWEPVSAFLRILPPGTRVPKGAKLAYIFPGDDRHMREWESGMDHETTAPHTLVSLPEPASDVPETVVVNGHTYRLDKENT